MKVIENKTTQVISIGFEGWDYILLPNTPVRCEEKVAEFLKERMPFLILSDIPKGTKGPAAIPQIERHKTPVLIQPIKTEDQGLDKSSMKRIPTFNVDVTMNPDNLPTSGMDTDGVEWVGPGLEKDDLTTN